MTEGTTSNEPDQGPRDNAPVLRCRYGLGGGGGGKGLVGFTPGTARPGGVRMGRGAGDGCCGIGFGVGDGRCGGLLADAFDDILRDLRRIIWDTQFGPQFPLASLQYPPIWLLALLSMILSVALT